MLAGQLALSLSVLPTLADGDTLTNTSLPLAPPSPANLVQKVWTSLDVQQKTTASTKQASMTSKRIAANSHKPSAKAEDSVSAESAKADSAATASTSTDLASTSNSSDNASSEPTEAALTSATSEARESSNETPNSSSINTASESVANNLADSKASETPSPTETTQSSNSINAQKPESASTGKATAADNKALNDAEPETTTSRGATTNGEMVFTGPDSSAKPVIEAPVQNESIAKDKATDNKIETPAISAKDLVKETSTEKGQSNTLEFHKPTAKASSSDKPFQIASALGQVSMPPGSVLSKVQAIDEGVIVIDNDEAQEVQETLKCEELPVTEGGASHAKAGARFPVVLASQITSKTAKVGDPLKAHLKFDLKIGDRLVAKKGSVVNGHINYVLHARTIMHSLLSPERWYRNSGCIGLAFDEIVNEKGEHLPLEAVPSRQARIVKNKAEGRELGVNHNGQVVGPWSEQIKYKAIRLGLNAAMGPAGVFTFGAMPVALGVLGAASPSFAFAKPVGLNVRHRRLKGFAWGFLSGVPGSFLIEDTTIKGQEAIVKPGDEFYAELVTEFTGEPASDAQLMSGTKTKVHGEVLKSPKKAKKNTP